MTCRRQRPARHYSRHDRRRSRRRPRRRRRRPHLRYYHDSKFKLSSSSDL